MANRILKSIAAAALIGAAALGAISPAEAGHRDAWGAGLLGFGVGAVVGGALAPPARSMSCRRPRPRPIIMGPSPMARRHGRPTGMPIAPRVTRASTRAPAISSASTVILVSAGSPIHAGRPSRL